MAIRYTLSLLLLALLVGCSAKTADKQSPDSSLATSKPLPPPPPPSAADTSKQQQQQKEPDATLMPLTPEPEHPATEWPEFDRLVGTLEKAVKHVYDSKGDVDNSDMKAIQDGLKAVGASGGSDPQRKIAADLSKDAIRDMDRMQEHLPSGRDVPPGIKIDLIRMPVTRSRDMVGSLPHDAQMAQIRRFEWMLVTLESAQRFADTKFDQERRKQP